LPYLPYIANLESGRFVAINEYFRSNSMNKPFAGYGGKRPLLYISFQRLFLDPLNPRLPTQTQGKSDDLIMATLKKLFYLEELAMSMAKNGYFDEEPLVAIPKNLPAKYVGKDYDELKKDEEYLAFLKNEDTEFVAVEGNRRLCTVKLLLAGTVSNFPHLAEEVREDLQMLPVIVYPERKDVISYLGVRHIIGVKKWDAYAKARYIASMKEEYGLTIEEIQKSVGDTSNSARKTYASYKLIETIESEFEHYDTSKAKDNFSYLMLALGQGPIKDFLGLPKQWGSVDQEMPVASGKIENLFLLFSWLFGEGKEKSKVIDESRDITGKLTSILRDGEATKYLIDYRDLNESYERCGGEVQLLTKYIKRATKDLGKAMPLITNPIYYSEEVDFLIKECERILESIKKLKT
jgi:hypothetical protein